MVFIEIAYSNSLQLYLKHPIEVKLTKKTFGSEIWTKQFKIGPKIRFFPFSQVWFI